MDIIFDKTDCQILEPYPKSCIYQAVIGVSVVLHIEFFNSGNIILVFSAIRIMDFHIHKKPLSVPEYDAIV